MTTVKKPPLGGSGYSGYPPGMVPGMCKRRITPHRQRLFVNRGCDVPWHLCASRDKRFGSPPGLLPSCPSEPRGGCRRPRLMLSVSSNARARQACGARVWGVQRHAYVDTEPRVKYSARLPTRCVCDDFARHPRHGRLTSTPCSPCGRRT